MNETLPLPPIHGAFSSRYILLHFVKRACVASPYMQTFIAKMKDKGYDLVFLFHEMHSGLSAAEYTAKIIGPLDSERRETTECKHMQMGSGFRVL